MKIRIKVDLDHGIISQEEVALVGYYITAFKRWNCRDAFWTSSWQEWQGAMGTRSRGNVRGTPPSVSFVSQGVEATWRGKTPRVLGE